MVVVESADKGGALITCDFALEQGRDVFAVPGNIDSPVSIATNKLLRDGAIPILGTADILDNYGWGTKTAGKAKPKDIPELNFQESVLYRFLSDGALHYDELSLMSQFDDSELASCLTIMELKGIICTLPGRRYEIV